MDDEEPSTVKQRAENYKRRATLVDVARLAGVSPSTVSRALNQPGRVNAETEQRIRDAAVLLDYPIDENQGTAATGNASISSASKAGAKELSQEQAGRTRQPTIYDVARVTGVNPSTVSRALNKPGRVNKKTEQMIREAAAELDYRLNPMARALFTGRTSTLGLVLPDITNPVFFTLVRGAEVVTSAEEYTLILAESQESGDLEAKTVERLLPSVDGLVLVSTRLEDAYIRHLADTKPLVVVNREVPGVESIVPDVVPGIRSALDHLAGMGHRALAFLAGPSTSWMSRLRWEALLNEAVARGMSIVEIGPADPTLQGGGDSLRRVVASGVTAVVAHNDLMAIGLLHACREAGIDVPHAISIVGFDDIFGSDFTSPPMTTIRTPLNLVGEEAVKRLVGAINSVCQVAEAPLKTEFVIRGSTGEASL